MTSAIYWEATFFQELSSDAAMPRNPSDEEIRRVQQALRNVLGRDLLPEEERYIGLSSVLMSTDELELVKPAACQSSIKSSKPGQKKVLSMESGSATQGTHPNPATLN